MSISNIWKKFKKCVNIIHIIIFFVSTCKFIYLIGKILVFHRYKGLMQFYQIITYILLQNFQN